MADIFKRRKVPAHLIIKDSYEYHRKPRSGLLRWVLWFVGLLLLTGLALELRYLNGRLWAEGALAGLLQERSVRRLHASVSHDGGVALAVVILED